MPMIKIHLKHAEYDAVERFASGVNVNLEALAYCALNRLMLDADNPALRSEITQTWDWHRENLPLWSDTGGGPHAYEGRPDDEPLPSKYLTPAPTVTAGSAPPQAFVPCGSECRFASALPAYAADYIWCVRFGAPYPAGRNATNCRGFSSRPNPTGSAPPPPPADPR